MQSTARPASSRIRPARWYTGALLLLIIATAVLYWPVTEFSFVNFDDDDYVYKNSFVSEGLTFSGLVQAFRPHAANWHPLTWISHMADVEWFGLNAGRHHATNLGLHLLNVVLLYLVMRRFSAPAWRALAVAALFALHPLNVETVAWIAERKSLLSTAAWLSCILAYHRWVQTRAARDYLLLIVLFAGGLMAKPMIVTMPLTLLILDFWPLKRLELSGPFTEWHSRATRLLFEKTPLFALAVASAVITYSAQSGWRAVSPFPWSVRLENAAVSLGWYLWKSVAPFGLCVYYPHPASLEERIPASIVIAALFIIAAIVLIAITQSRRRPYLLAGVLWFLVTLAPVLGIIQVGGQAHADRYAYVPLLGVFVVLVWVVGDVAAWCHASWLPPALGLLYCGFLGVATSQQIQFWRNSETLFTRALVTTAGRNPVARRNLASYYTEAGNLERARGDRAASLNLFQKASAADPGSATVWFNEAVTLAEMGQYAEAIPRYLRSLSRDPSNADAWLNLGDAQVTTNNMEAAITAYSRVLSLRSDRYADYGLGYACFRTGDLQCALLALQRLQTADPALAGELRRRISLQP